MLSSLTAEYDFTKETLSEIVEKTYEITPNSIVKVYIPTLMPNIQKGDPEISALETNGYGVFKNDGSCRPALTSQILKEQNYLEAKMQNNSNIELIKEIDPEEIPFIPKDAVIRTTFLNGKMKDLFYNTNTNYKRGTSSKRSK